MRPVALCCATGLPGALAIASISLASLGDDSNWVNSRFYPFGPDTEVWSCIEHDGDLVISGNFVAVDDQLISGVARWDGSQWVGYPGIDRGGILVERNGQLSVVQAWGSNDFYTLYQVQSWNGTDWDTSPFIFQLTGGAFGFDATHRVAGSAAVYEGQILIAPFFGFPASSYFDFQDATNATIASWDGGTWSAFVPAVAPIDEYLDVEVWGGQVWTSGSDSNYDVFIGNWNGASWSRWFISGGAVFDFGFHGGDLFAAQSSGQVLTWTGTSWSVHASSAGSSGEFEVSGSDQGLALGADEVTVWDGSAWSLLGDLGGKVNELMDSPDGLVATGDFPGKVAIHDGASWDLPGRKNGQGLDGEVHALLPFQGRLYAAGNFLLPGTSNRAMLAAWDGAVWEQVGPAASASWFFGARALAVFDGKLMIGATSGLFEWDGTVWNTFVSGDGFDALAVFDGDLVAAGLFDNLFGTAERLAVWDGTSWSALSGPAGSVEDLIVWDGDLIVGGSFTSVDGDPIAHITSWSGSQWKDLEPNGNHPPRVTGPVTALAVHDGNLVASGDFWSGTEFIAEWDGKDWAALGTGLDTAPQALHSTGGLLFASGSDLSGAGVVPVNRIGVWNGTSWDALGSGLEHPRPNEGGYGRPTVFYDRGWAFAEHQGLLYVGGNFRVAGGKPADHLAMWASPAAVAVPPDEPGGLTFAVRPGLPNPFRSTTRIPLSLPRAGRVMAEVFDIAGRKLGTIFDRDLPPGEITIPWNPHTMQTVSGENVSAGMYFIRVHALGESRARKVVYIP